MLLLVWFSVSELRSVWNSATELETYCAALFRYAFCFILFDRMFSFTGAYGCFIGFFRLFTDMNLRFICIHGCALFHWQRLFIINNSNQA